MPVKSLKNTEITKKVRIPKKPQCISRYVTHMTFASSAVLTYLTLSAGWKTIYGTN